MYTTGNTTNSVLSLSPELMKELAECISPLQRKVLTH